MTEYGRAADRFGQLAALFIADVSGRRADQTRHGVFLHILRHIDADEVLLVVEQRLGTASWPAPSCRRRSGPGTGTSRADGSGPESRRGCAGWPRRRRRTASSCPMTRLWSISSRCSSFSRSPSISRATGIPVQRSMIRAISSSVTLLRSRVVLLGVLRQLLFLLRAAFCSFGQFAVFQLRRLFEVVRSARPVRCRRSAASISSRSCCTLPMAFFSFSHWAFMALKLSRASRPVPSADLRQDALRRAHRPLS